MEALELEITLLPLDDEAASWATQTSFEDVAKELQVREALILSRPVVLQPGYVGASDLLSGEFLIKWIPALGSIVSAATGAWLHARYGRRVRLKVGDVEAEAQTPEELAKLLDQVQQIREGNEPKRIIL